MKSLSGSPAYKVQCTLDQWFNKSSLDGLKEFIISPRDTGRMVYYDFEEYDTQDDKDALWGGY